MSRQALWDRLNRFESAIMRLSVGVTEAKGILKRNLEEECNFSRLQIVLVETRDEMNRLLNAINDFDIND